MFVLAMMMLLPAVSAAVPAPGTGILSDSAVVHGVVVDAETGQPLPGTIVRVVGLSRRDVTHENGEFHLNDLPAGQVTIVFEMLGYQRAVREVDLAPGASVELRIELRTSAIILPGIVVTGMTRAGLGEEAVRPAAVLSGQELTRRMDATLAGTLRSEPGLSSTSVGPATARPVIRGLGGDRVLILEDGGRVGDLSSSSSDHALSVEPLNAQRIEVVRGPAALLYGSNAIGGVINVIREEVPNNVPERATGMVSVQGQSVNDGLAAGVSGQTGAGPIAISGSGSYRDSGDLDTPQGMLDNTDQRTLSMSAGASRVNPRGHYGAAYRYYGNEYGVPGGFVGSHPEGVRIEMRRHSLHGQAQLQRPVGPFSSIEADAKYTNYHHRELETGDVVGTEYGLLSAAGELTARHADVGPFASGAMGVRVDWDDFVAGGSTQTPPSRSWTAAAYALEEFDIGRLRVQAGGRFDWHRIEPLDTTTARDIGRVRTRTFASVAASIGALYTLRDGISAGVSLARAYRTPDTNELFSQGPHLAAYSYEVGNPDLDAEIGMGIDVFVRARRDRFSGEVAMFRNALANYIYYRDTGERSPTDLPIYQATGTDAVLRGFEVSGSAELFRHTALNGTVSYVEGSFSDTDEPLPMIPPLNGQLSVRYDRSRVFAGVGVRATAEQDRIAEFEAPTPGYTVVDADVGVRWVALGRVHTVTARVENATDEVIHDHLSRIRDPETGRRAAGAGRGASIVYRVVF